MPKPELTENFVPQYDETKLAKTPFKKLMDAYVEAKARAIEAETAANEYRAQMSALMLKANIDGVRVEGFTARWVPAGKPGKKLDPTKVLEVLKGDTKTFNRCFTTTEPRAAYFRISGGNGDAE